VPTLIAFDVIRLARFRGSIGRAGVTRGWALLGNCTRVFYIHGVDRGELRQCAGASTTSSVRPPAIASAYCLPVSAGFLESDAKASEELRKCSRGDTVVIPARSLGAVARMRLLESLPWVKAWFAFWYSRSAPANKVGFRASVCSVPSSQQIEHLPSLLPTHNQFHQTLPQIRSETEIT
jgi:hypothetical protein